VCFWAGGVTRVDTIFLPTLGRVQQQITYDALPPELQSKVVFVVQAWEREKYAYDAEYLILPPTITPDHPRALAETRRIIYEMGTTRKYVMLDDDLSFLRRNAKYWSGVSNMDTSLRPCTHDDLIEMFDLYTGWLDDADCTVCGCSQVQNIPAHTIFRKHTSLTSGLWINGPNFAHELPTMDVTATRVAEDVVFLLSLLSRGYGNRVSTEFVINNASLSRRDLHSHVWDHVTFDSVHGDHKTVASMFPTIFTILYDDTGSRVQGGFRNYGKTRIFWNNAYRQSQFRTLPLNPR
jgi:hypothetical protein